jgi:hypothetical protein
MPFFKGMWCNLDTHELFLDNSLLYDKFNRTGLTGNEMGPVSMVNETLRIKSFTEQITVITFTAFFPRPRDPLPLPRLRARPRPRPLIF